MRRGLRLVRDAVRDLPSLVARQMETARPIEVILADLVATLAATPAAAPGGIRIGYRQEAPAVQAQIGIDLDSDGWEVV